jgi:hypothetical protein
MPSVPGPRPPAFDAPGCLPGSGIGQVTVGDVDAADLAYRSALLTEPLRERLAGHWPHLTVQLDTSAATTRPGASIGIRWSDGPPLEAVRRALAPAFTDRASGAVPTGRYPVDLLRSYSPTALAAAVLQLHHTGRLGEVLRAGRAAFWVAVDGHLLPVELPAAIDHQLWQRARMLAQLTSALAGGDAHTWARWLEDGGWSQIDPPLDAVLAPAADAGQAH